MIIFKLISTFKIKYYIHLNINSYRKMSYRISFAFFFVSHFDLFITDQLKILLSEVR